VTCTTNSFTVGGSISGLSGSGLVLINNRGDQLALTPNHNLHVSYRRDQRRL
jgi:hypothetical protein